MRLSDIISCDYDFEILGLSDDSRKVKKGYVFFVTRGFNVDRIDFIFAAINNGAVAIVTDRVLNIDFPTVLVDNVKNSLIECCKIFFNINLKDFCFIGVTGTDGKTTTTSIVEQLLNPFVKTAYIGTNGLKIGDKYFQTNNTTPDIVDLFECLCLASTNGCKYISMEVSSEALLHGRVDNLIFYSIGYTNITEDHLNVHKNLENYISCKKKLIDLLDIKGSCFINGDDVNCKSIVGNNVYTYGFLNTNDYVIYDVKKKNKCVKFKIKAFGFIYEINSPFVEEFNIYNVTLAFLLCMSLNIDIGSSILIKKIKYLKPIFGRMERLNFGQKYDLILDYAHTYNAIKNVLNFYYGKKCLVVTGAAGGREKQKRSKIGKLLLEKSDFVVFTTDDPRNEDPMDIINQMIDNSIATNYSVILDREKAIVYSLDLAVDYDVILILGKGRDNYMAIGNDKIYYCDFDVISNYFC